MTSSNKPAPADTTAPAQTTTGSSTPTEISSPPQTAAAATAETGGDAGIISPDIEDAAFTADDLADIELADSPYYQLSSRITQLLGEREIVAALGNTERVYAVDKELGEMRWVWDDRDTTTTEARGTPPEGRQTLRERQIRTGGGPAASAPPPQRPAPATATTAAGTTASGEDTTTPSTSSPTAAKTSPVTPATSTAATPTTTGGSEAKP